MSIHACVRRRECLGILLVAILAVSVATSRPSPASGFDRWDSVRGVVRRTMEQQRIASISVAIAKDGQILWEDSFGWADQERRIAATPKTMYSLASISKPITATGLMVLVERGKIDLNKPANEYLGAGKLTGLAGDAREATVRRVMSHTAGLPLHYQFYYITDNYGPPASDDTITRYGILVNPPGQVYEYSNLGYGIIDHIITRVSGTTYDDFMRKEVFVPLGLDHTSVGIASELQSFVAQRYDSEGRPIPVYDFDHRGASAVFSSAHDLVRFGMFHLKSHLRDQKPIVTDGSIDLMHTAVPPAQYGLGWGVTEDDNGYLRYSHAGGMPGVSTALGLYPSEHLAVVVLANGVGSVGPIANEMTAAVLPKFAEVRQRAADQAPRPTTPPAFLPAEELLGSWTGTIRTWERNLPVSLAVASNGDVNIRMDGEQEMPVQGLSWNNGTLRGQFLGKIPTSDAARWPHTVYLNLTLRQSTLSGMASAMSSDHFGLTSYVALIKQASVR